MKSILDRVALGLAHWAKVYDPTIVKGDHHIEKGGMCCCRLHACTNACYGLGSNPERGPNVECSVRLAEGTEEDRFEGTSGRIHLQ